MARRVAWAWAVPGMLLAAALAGAQPQPTVITVDARKTVGKVNPRVFGGNILGYQKGSTFYPGPDFSDRAAGMWNPEARRPVPEMVALAKRAGLSVARWPGGCNVHAFDWKKTVGPVERRPDQKFGLPEFLRLCDAMGATPLITLSDYHGGPQDAADMVEYLNAPDDGRHPWAARRAADGRRASWNVVWFEYGNESEHGLHFGMEDFGSRRRFTPEEYARNFMAYRAAMRRVDPKIKLGAVLATAFPNLEEWARPVARRVGRQMDFAIHHSYKPAYSANDGQPDTQSLFAAALACPDEIQAYYDGLNALLRETTGRPNTPIAVTEFNGSFVQERPVPYRHTLGNALLNAEMLRVFLQPRNHIYMANFWQFANEYWGAVKAFPQRGEVVVLRPQYYPFALYRAHFGPDLLEARVVCGTYETAGLPAHGVAPHFGKGSRFRLHESIPLSKPWSITARAGVEQRMEGDTLAVTFAGGEDVNYYHARRTFPAAPRTGYRVTGWVKTEALTGGMGATFQVSDARGWVVTHSAAISPGVTGTRDWTKVTVDYVTLADTREVEVLARWLDGGGPVSGRALFRDVRVQRYTPEVFAAAPYLSVNASRSADSRKVYLMVVNRRLDGPVKAQVKLRGFLPRRAMLHTLEGSSVDATNESDPKAVGVRTRAVPAGQGELTITFPPHSLTAVVLEGTKPDR